jgi:hypothetical protein
MNGDPFYDSLRSDARFDDLLQHVANESRPSAKVDAAAIRK